MKDLPGDSSIRDFLTALASAEDGHGAVSAATVAGGLGTSLLMMVASLPKTRSDSISDRTTLIAAGTALNDVQAQLLEAIETDTAVKLFAARNLPRASASQRGERHAAIQIALRAAADVPLEVMRLCVRGLQQAEIVAAHSIRAASPDVQLGISLLLAAFRGAHSNLEAKISSLTDTEYIRSLVDQIASLSDEATAATQAAEESLRLPAA